MKKDSEMNGEYNMDNEILVTSIKQLCQKNNISVSQLENDLKFSPSLISRWKDKTPSVDKIVNIADYFRVSLDEVVGYNLNINDTFLNTLYEKTSNGSIVWEDVETMNKQGIMVKQYSDFCMPGQYIADDEKETTYATCFNSGYIAMYAYHRYNQIIHPFNLILFIQPSDNAFLVDQHYTKEELSGLWVKILNSLGDNAPDEVKAEDLKNEFVLEHAPIDRTNKISNKEELPDIEKIVDNPAVVKLMELCNKPEFQELQNTLSSPQVQAAIQTANKVQKYLDKKN